jgi:predicted MFS family arabinose efflux permease
MTWRANRAMLGSCALRPLLVAQWVPNGLIVAAEAQFVPYAGSAAGVLFVCSAAGMLVGDTIVGRFLSPALQRRAVFPLLVLLAVPYLALAFHPPIAVAAAAVTLASVGYGSTLCLQARMLELVPAARQSQAFGLAYSGTMTGQAAMTLLIGGASDVVGAAGAVGAAAVMSLLVTALLARPIRATAPMTEIGARAFS